MALTGYILPADFVPPSEYINDPLQSLEYVGFRLSQDLLANTSIWTFNQVVSSPSVALEDLLPSGTQTVLIDDDLIKFGYQRQFLTGLNIIDVESVIEDSVSDIA